MNPIVLTASLRFLFKDTPRETCMKIKDDMRTTSELNPRVYSRFYGGECVDTNIRYSNVKSEH
jgi:hypothetical protein